MDEIKRTINVASANAVVVSQVFYQNIQAWNATQWSCQEFRTSHAMKSKGLVAHVER